jgi:hypothetical protein
MLEVIIRERETELASIAKNKEVEGEKRDIAEVIRERISVEKTVAEQEEAIKRVRIVEDASRNREARIINAEAEAQEHLVKDIKAAEAAETASKFKAREQLVLAEARQQAAELDAQAAIRTAEGLRAEAAAAGLAEVEVREADAEAIEKVGRAEAVVLKEKGLAQAEATDKVGRAEAGVLREMALSEAESIKAKLKGEAEGLTEKAAAMAALDDASRGHEEFRLRLQADKDIRIAEIDVQRQVAEAQATVLATGLESADISIVGGDTVFFDRLVGAMSWGKAVEGFVGQSPTVREFAPELLKSLGSVDTGDVKNLTVSALLLKLIRAGGPDSGKLHELLDTARKMGVAETPVLNGTH